MLKLWQELKSNDSSSLPAKLKGNQDALAYYRLLLKILSEALSKNSGIDLKSIAATLAEETDSIIEHHKVRDWKTRDDIKNAMVNDLEDMVYDLQEQQVPDLTTEKRLMPFWKQ